MGVLNVTPDSFSDGGRHAAPAEAIDLAAEMVRHEVDIVDVGGESTRPGAAPVPEQEELDRVIPVIDAIRGRFPVRLSIDTSKARVAAEALGAGADLVNDISALSDPAMVSVIVERRAPVVLMHMRGTPDSMQRDTGYDDLVGEVSAFLEQRAESIVAAGVADDKILLDPGIGFGKSAKGNLQLLARLSMLRSLGRPILVGASRKSFIGTALGLPVDERLEASVAVAAYASAQGAHVVRVHDVAETTRGVRIVDAIREAAQTSR
jgi:dihydropteroate synthase